MRYGGPAGTPCFRFVFVDFPSAARSAVKLTPSAAGTARSAASIKKRKVPLSWNGGTMMSWYGTPNSCWYQSKPLVPTGIGSTKMSWYEGIKMSIPSSSW